MRCELDRILTYWTDRTVDREHGGFYGSLNGESIVISGAPKGLVLNARLLWTFSRAYRTDRKTVYLQMAERALGELERSFKDPVYGGYYWMAAPSGEPVQTRKQIYGQAFVLYALSEYVLATGSRQLLPDIQALVDIVERSYDPVHGGYFEAYTREWELESDLRLSEHDMNEKKSMNTHLHILEAYTNVYRVWPSSIMALRLRSLIGLTLDRIVGGDGHFRLFFDEDWRVKSDRISYGHDIEGSWLLYEAAEALGDTELIALAKKAALAMADATLAEGVDRDGALWNEAGPEGLIDTDKDWWPQAEAVVGFVNAWQMTGDDRYWEAAWKTWSFIRTSVVDREHGEWFWKVDASGVPYKEEPKVSEWKCPYHNGRACMEIIERLGPLIQEA